MATRAPTAGSADAAGLARADAAATGLRYVSPEDPGIRRRRAGRGFTYLDPRGRRVRSPQELARIRAIAIPPAWTDVWICPEPHGHLQAVGRDSRGRRQYRYHRRFRARRDAGKFARLIRFGERLPRIRRRSGTDLRARGHTREKVLAVVVSLLDATSLRVGGDAYARLNRSFGVSTLRNRHATIKGSTIRFRFRGKGGRTEERDVVDRRLAGIVRRCQELPGQALFQYIDASGEARGVSSEDVNAYLREAAGDDGVSAKDFRTWAATLLAYRTLRESAGDDDGTAGASEAKGGHRADASRGRRRSLIAAALRDTARDIGDSVAVTRSAYVHPGMLDAVERGAEIKARRRAPDGRPDRQAERDLLELLRTVERSNAPSAARPRPARRSQVGTPRVASRRGRTGS